MLNEQLLILHQQGMISALDLYFTRFIGQLEQLADHGNTDVALAALMVSVETGNGHVCINLPGLAGQVLFDTEHNEQRLSLTAPGWPEWAKALRDSRCVGHPGEFRPLILDFQGRLYLYRYWDYEQRLAKELTQRSHSDRPEINLDALKETLAQLFPKPQNTKTSTTAVDWQKIAAVTALLRRFCVISGGPGTGKTTTVIRILVLLLEQNQRQPQRIALAAPTGKAAARMQEAIRLAKQRLALEPSLQELIPDQATTLHRLLGPRNHSVYFHHQRDNPLPVDILVIDEASMIDLALMSKLLDALPASARLILLGDKDQLASVEAGAVLGDICGDVPGFSEAFRQQLRELSGEPVPSRQSDRSIPELADNIVLLRDSYRFAADSGIGALAQAVNQGRGERSVALLQGQQFNDIQWHDVDSASNLWPNLAEVVSDGFRHYLEKIQQGADVHEIFSEFNRFRVLCALRSGPFGVDNANRMIERILQARRLLRIRNSRSPWYPGRPVMITRNDYNLRLYNGDIGITLADPEDNHQLKVFFQSDEDNDQFRQLPVMRLPEHEAVYAMTIHKSQGSEFDRVSLLLPVEASRVIGRELLYTGITRARQHVDIWSRQEVFKKGVEHNLQRSSGLRDRLWKRNV